MPTYEPTGVKVKGLNSITRALRDVGVPNVEIREAAKESADLVKREATSLVPVRSGKLRDSIRLNAIASGRIRIEAGNNRTTKSGVPYANPIHWGWFKRNIKPQPFFIKAIGITRDEVYRNYFAKLSKMIEREVAKQKAAND